MNAPGQVETLRDELLPPPKHEPDANSQPRMPFKTSYRLTRAQEDALVDHALERIKQLEGQLGRKFKEGGHGRGQAGMQATIEDPESFMGKRERYMLRYYNYVQDRAGGPIESVYDHSNLTASLSQRITMQMIARAILFFFGQPDDVDWFSTNAVGAEDEDASDKIKKHSRWKVDQCGVKHRLTESLEFAFVLGEAIPKVTHQERSQIFKRTATVLMGGLDENGNPSNDEPFLDANGDYICQGDRFVDEMQAPVQPKPGLLSKIKTFLTGPEPGAVAAAGTGTTSTASTSPGDPMAEAAAAPTPVPTGRKILKRDGVTVLPDSAVWSTQEITRRLVTFEGPDAQVVYFKDFLCPETATDVQTADLIAHLYDMDVMKIAQMFRGQYGEGDAAIEDMTKAVESLRGMLNTSNEPKAAANQPRTNFQETDTTGAVGVPQVLVAESYLTYDADGDGIQEEIMLVLDRENKAPIYYEYLANVTVKGLRPFYPQRPMPVLGRWYGMGAMELFDPEQTFVDLQINRHNFRSSSKGLVTFWEPSATLEGQRDPNLKLNQGKTYSLRDGKKAEDALTYVQLPGDEEALEYLLNLFMQLMQLKSGVLTGADRATASLPGSDTLGEEKLITESGDELFNRMLAHLFPGVKATLAAVIDVTYANMNRVEVFNYFNGEADEILQLDPAEVRDLALNVTLELSRTQARKAQESGDKTTALVSWFYGLPFVLQQRACSYARQQLKGLGVSQADKLIDPVDLAAGQPTSDDKPSAVGTMIAALIKVGAPITTEVVSAVMQKAGLPQLPGPAQETIEAPKPPAKEEPAAPAV